MKLKHLFGKRLEIREVISHLDYLDNPEFKVQTFNSTRNHNYSNRMYNNHKAGLESSLIW